MNELLIENGFSIEETNRAMEILKPTTHEYALKEVLFGLSEQAVGEIAILLKGSAVLTSVGSDGQKNIIDFYSRGDSYGGRLFPESENTAFYVAAKSKCTAVRIGFGKITKLMNDCPDLGVRFFDMTLLPAVNRLQLHTDILGQRTIRGKLIYVIDYFSKLQNRRQVILPFSLTDLADYISADRSAMMRELKKLNDEGLIYSKGRKILMIRL
jgi:CRP-like cAMP-binding protein